MNPNRLLVIDDEADIAEFVGDVAEGLGFEVTVTTGAEEFWASYSEFEPSVIVLDLNMPGMDGVELLRSLGEKRCRAHVAIISGVDSRVIATAQRLGVDHGLNMLGVLRKPIGLQALRDMLARTVEEERPVTADDLRRAIEDGQLVVHYQPKADLKSERVFRVEACEALVRWEHPRHGMMTPRMFISLAESSGLIAPLTEHVLGVVVRQLKSWNDAGLTLSVAVNIAPQLLEDLTLPDRISTLLTEHGVEPSQVILEITESGAMANAARTMDILIRFRLKGFGLSLDDFGTGYSSLIQLHRMPFNEMKIDKSFVLELGSGLITRS